MTIKIKSIVSYGRYYPSLVDADVTYWWFCVNDCKIYSTETLITDFHYTDSVDIEQSGVFIPLFKTDIEKLEKEYLLTRPNEEIREYRKVKEKNSGTDPDTIFKIFVDRMCLWKSWYAFEYQRLFQDAVSWCNANHIAYVQE